MTAIRPCLWFDRQAEEAARFYTSLLPNSSVDHVQRSPTDYPNGKAGDVLVVEFTLAGQPYMALNGGPDKPFTEAVSLALTIDTQDEVDRLWDGLLAEGGSPIACGWLKDRYGLRWQVTPAELPRLIGDPDPARAARAMRAMMEMTKIDTAALRAAADAAP